jgi:hypothetical protein
VVTIVVGAAVIAIAAVAVCVAVVVGAVAVVDVGAAAVAVAAVVVAVVGVRGFSWGAAAAAGARVGLVLARRGYNQWAWRQEGIPNGVVPLVEVEKALRCERLNDHLDTKNCYIKYRIVFILKILLKLDESKSVT